MNLRTGLIAVVVAAAGGAAAGRALARPPRAPASLDLGVAKAAAGDASLASPQHERRSAAFPSARHGPVVYVAGEVVRPGVYRVSSDARAVDALHLAGGPTKSADLVAVNLAAVVEDGTEIVVPARGASNPSVVSGGAARSRVARSHRRTRTTTHRRRKRATPVDSGVNDSAAATVNLNAADAAALETLPGIGPALAARIVEFRSVNGAFASTDELLDVAGMTQSKVDELTPYVTF